jgi:hypothetical protein
MGQLSTKAFTKVSPPVTLSHIAEYIADGWSQFTMCVPDVRILFSALVLVFGVRLLWFYTQLWEQYLK